MNLSLLTLNIDMAMSPVVWGKIPLTLDTYRKARHSTGIFPMDKRVID